MDNNAMTIINTNNSSDTNLNNVNNIAAIKANKSIAFDAKPVRTPTPTVTPSLLFPGFPSARRYSDGLARPTISVSCVDDENNEEGVLGVNRKRANSYSPLMPSPSSSLNNNGNRRGEEIVCSTGELMNLKCLSHSVVEMRVLQNNEGYTGGGRKGSLFSPMGNNGNVNPQHQRSRSFDATAYGKKSPGVKSNLFSGLLTRLKAGVSGTSTSPPNNNDKQDGSNFLNQTNFEEVGLGEKGCPSSTNAPPTTPVSTVLVVDPTGRGPAIVTLSPTPTATPQITSGDRSPVAEAGGQTTSETKKGIPWDNNTGYFLDATTLGLAIENHLKLGDTKGKRRATFCTLSETNNQFLGQTSAPNNGLFLSQPNNRPRSASAYSVLPFLHSSGGGPVSSGDPEVITRRRESIASTFPTSNEGLALLLISQAGRRNSSFTTTSSEYLQSPSSQSGEDVLVGSFIKSTVTSELYSEGEVIVEEEQRDIDNYNNQIPQNVKKMQRVESTSSFLFRGIDFWNRKTSCGGRGVMTINEEDEEAVNGVGGTGVHNQEQNTFCGFFQRVVLQIINSLFRS